MKSVIANRRPIGFGLALSAIVAFMVAATGGPVWAAFGFGLVTYLVVRLGWQ